MSKSNHVEDYLYYRLVVCWFKATMRLNHKSDVDKFRRMRELYPDQYNDAWLELRVEDARK